MIMDLQVTGDVAPPGASNPQMLWFCIKTHPKHEHLAAAGLNKVGGFEVFNPQMRTRKMTKRGLVWFTESVFAGYIFVRLNLQRDLGTVRCSTSVSQVVHFNSGYPSIPEDEMRRMQTIFNGDTPITITMAPSEGDTVRIIGGAFNDLAAVVLRVMPAKQRVQALLSFLGRMTTVELNIHQVAVAEASKTVCHPLDRAAFNPPSGNKASGQDAA
jgi:transcription antitermination factor NusG